MKPHLSVRHRILRDFKYPGHTCIYKQIRFKHMDHYLDTVLLDNVQVAEHVRPLSKGALNKNKDTQLAL